MQFRSSNNIYRKSGFGLHQLRNRFHAGMRTSLVAGTIRAGRMRAPVTTRRQTLGRGAETDNVICSLNCLETVTLRSSDKGNTTIEFVVQRLGQPGRAMRLTHSASTGRLRSQAVARKHDVEDLSKAHPIF
jgi:hypothetical protein